MEFPCVLFIDCHEKTCGKMIEDLLKIENQPFPSNSKISNRVVSHFWSLETKYYTAEINLCSLKSLTNFEETLNSLHDSVEGILLSFDPENEQSFERVKVIYSSLKGDYPFKILACTSLKYKPHKADVLEWCISNEFELVELEIDEEEEEEDDEEKEDEIIRERKGLERVAEIIKCHQWSNLTLKGKSRKKGGKDGGDVVGDSHNSDDNDNKTNSGKDDFNDNDNNHGDDDDTSGSDEYSKAHKPAEQCDEDKLGKLFQSIPTLKEKADSLGFEERKGFAEEVVLKFWSAIGGDVEEVDDDDDD